MGGVGTRQGKQVVLHLLSVDCCFGGSGRGGRLSNSAQLRIGLHSPKTSTKVTESGRPKVRVISCSPAPPDMHVYGGAMNSFV